MKTSNWSILTSFAFRWSILGMEHLSWLRLQRITGFSSGIFYSHPISARRMRRRSSPSRSRNVCSYSALSLGLAIPLRHSHLAFYCSCYRNTSPLDTCSCLRKTVWFQPVACAWLVTTPFSTCSPQSAVCRGVSAPSVGTRCRCAAARYTTKRALECTALRAGFDA